MTSIETWRTAAEHYQRVADERRIKEIRHRDEQPMVIGLAILAVMGIFTLVLLAIGVLT